MLFSSHENIFIFLPLALAGYFGLRLFAGKTVTLFWLICASLTFYAVWDPWIGAMAYTLQLYFDFSGYSDMAIGLGLLFGIRLPLNFNSPYKDIRRQTSSIFGGAGT
jgi:alginate O-acetyltransferase complex protein AlgI